DDRLDDLERQVEAALADADLEPGRRAGLARAHRAAGVASDARSGAGGAYWGASSAKSRRARSRSAVDQPISRAIRSATVSAAARAPRPSSRSRRVRRASTA